MLTIENIPFDSLCDNIIQNEPIHIYSWCNSPFLLQQMWTNHVCFTSELYHSVTSYGVSQVALVVKNLCANVREDVRDTGSISGSGRFPRGGHGNPLQCSFLENRTDRGTWQAVVHSVAQSQIQLKRLSMHAHGFIFYTPLLMNINFNFFPQIFATINYAAVIWISF